MERWVEETLHRGFRVRLKADTVLFDSETEHQRLIIFDNADFGRVMMLDNVVSKNAEVTDKEIEAAYAEHSATMVRDGKKVPLAMVKEQIRAALRNQKGEKTVDAYLVELKKKAKITVNDAVLPKV